MQGYSFPRVSDVKSSMFIGTHLAKYSMRCGCGCGFVRLSAMCLYNFTEFGVGTGMQDTLGPTLNLGNFVRETASPSPKTVRVLLLCAAAVE